MDAVTLSEAARAVGLHKSTISRQVKAGQIPNHGTDGRPLVRIEEVRRARQLTIDPAFSSAPGLGLRAPLGGHDEPHADIPARPDRPSFNDARTARETIQATLARLELDERLGKLVSKDAVQAQAFTTSRLVRDAVLGVPMMIAEQIAGLAEPREIRLLLEGALKEALRLAAASLKSEEMPIGLPLESELGDDLARA